MNHIQAATRIQSLTRGYFKRKNIRQNLETQPVSFSNLQNGPLDKMCSLLDLNTRLSLTLTSTQFSPLELSSLGTVALQRLATHEATLWINDQLQLVDQDPIELIKKINNKEVLIPDYLVKRIVSNILANQAIDLANTISDDECKTSALKNICKTLLANRNIERAIDVANTISDDEYKSFALADITKYYLEREGIEQAIDFTNKISADDEKSLALYVISKTLLANGNFDQAIEVLLTIPS